METKQIGISPKVWAPVALQFVALLTTWIANGSFDRVQLAQAITLAATAIIGALASPGEVEQTVTDFIPGGGKPDAG